MQNPTDKEVLDYIDSVPGLRDEWGINGSKHLATGAFVLMNLMLLALLVGTFAYFALTDSSTAMNHISGLIIVIVLAYAIAAVRILQLRATHRDLAEFRKLLANRLTGNPETDIEAQNKAEQDHEWTMKRYTYAARMIGIAALIILSINTYQIGVDAERTLIFDAAILSYLAGMFWSNFALKAGLLEIELQERSRSTMRWQTEHPEAMLGQLEDGTADDIDDDEGFDD
jgi:uncharacterized membrane protein